MSIILNTINRAILFLRANTRHICEQGHLRRTRRRLASRDVSPSAITRAVVCNRVLAIFSPTSVQTRERRANLSRGRDRGS